MAERFLNPPPGPTALRAPQPNEAANPIESLAAQGQRDPITGIAQLLMRAAPAIQAGMSALGGSPASTSAILGGPNSRLAPGGGFARPSMNDAALDLSRQRVLENTLRGFMNNLTSHLKQQEVAAARQPYPGGADYLLVPNPPAAIPPPSVPMPRAPSSRQTDIGPRGARGIDARAVDLSADEIRELLSVMPRISNPKYKLGDRGRSSKSRGD